MCLAFSMNDGGLGGGGKAHYHLRAKCNYLRKSAPNSRNNLLSDFFNLFNISTEMLPPLNKLSSNILYNRTTGMYLFLNKIPRQRQY